MIAKYYKFHEWIPFRAAIDMPATAPLVTFVTDFGVRFGVFMCFDMFFPSPAMDLVDMGIEHFVYSVAMNLRLGKSVRLLFFFLHLFSSLGPELSIAPFVIFCRFTSPGRIKPTQCCCLPTLVSAGAGSSIMAWSPPTNPTRSRASTRTALKWVTSSACEPDLH